jgi:molybdopterin/thiamine biosynthesis adenylyltransferase
LVRAGQESRLVRQADLDAWAQECGLTARQAVAAALSEGVFPECWQRNFPSLNVGQQLRLFESCVLVVGLGGLGGAQAVLLARVGVGRMLLADGDVFAPSNLNRQFLATQATLDRNKAQVTAAYLQEINPALLVQAIPDFLNADNLPEYLRQSQVVLDGLDSLKARRELVAAAGKMEKPLVHGAVHGQFGQVSTILPEDGDSLARIYAGQTDAAAAVPEVLAPTVSLVASLQVQEALRLLLGQTPAYHGRLAHFDGDTGRLEILPLR